jgi:ankyrin repeat protein
MLILNTPLIIAIKHNNIDAVKLLLNEGACVCRKAFSIAVQLGYTSMVDLLIENGVNINVNEYLWEKFVDCATPLHYAACEGYIDMIELLIRKDADINARDRHGYTPLTCAMDGEHYDIVDLLERHGATT